MAIAAPTTPILNIPVKIISPATLTAQAIATKYIGVLESPKPRRIPAITLKAIIKGSPAEQIVT